VTAERRLAAVEAALTPTELVVAWLEDAHGYGSLEDAVRSMLAAEEPVPPMDRADLLRRLDRNAEAAHAYDTALVLSTNAIEHAFLERARARLVDGSFEGDPLHPSLINRTIWS
jgi:RNA polymerase sigma-70 factor (ECF subfamily)